MNFRYALEHYQSLSQEIERLKELMVLYYREGMGSSLPVILSDIESKEAELEALMNMDVVKRED